MMANVKYHFGVLRNVKEQQCSARLHQEDTDSMQYTLDDDDEAYSTILGSCSTNNGPSSLLLGMRPSNGHDDDDENGVSSKEGSQKKTLNHAQQQQQQQHQMTNGSGKQKMNWQKNGGRGPARLRNSTSKCSSLLTDEVELDDVAEEELTARHSDGSDDDLDDLLPTTTAVSGLSTDIYAESQQPPDGNGSSINSWKSRFRRRLKTLACCFPMRFTGENEGFIQFK